jgi:hypothetical protein
MNMAKRKFGGLSVAAAASVWARPAVGVDRDGAGFVDPLIGVGETEDPPSVPSVRLRAFL